MASQSEKAAESAKRYSRAAKDKLQDVADYVSDSDAEDMGRDLIQTTTAHPVASLLVLGAVVIGGGMLVAAMLHDDRANESGESRRLMRLTSAAGGMGPRAAESLSRIRDAAFSFALAKAVDTVDGMFPGFREHYERA